MAKKPWLPIALLVVIGGLFIYLNRDWFQRRPIQISHRLYRFAGRFGGADTPTPVMFEFDRRLKLTSIKVVGLADSPDEQIPAAPLAYDYKLQLRADQRLCLRHGCPGDAFGSERRDCRTA